MEATPGVGPSTTVTTLEVDDLVDVSTSATTVT